ncbi:phage major capsid protein, HK97 family [Azotobacter beijerinckii]|uniref:Phage major capsid protein, HK97 family n=1 Tax=Azotobacter beijerinckii TaxID=170623 RepID=A0A1H6XRH5_9GAMM|nr:phage major capsid protein [Azotobacter beijerinckii]SEJ31688.1 phage major capsid protein, HK97 family [Azotobacter beijerinckii]
MPSENFETQVKELNASLTKIGDQLKASAEKVEKDIKRTGEMNAETRAKVDEMLTKQGELQARLLEAEQKLIHAGTPQAPKPRLTAGQMVVASADMEGVNSSFRGARRVAVPRAAITSIGSDTNRITPAERRPEIVAGATRRLTIRDLIAPGQTGAGAVEYVRETGFTNNAAAVAEGGQKPYSEITFGLETANVRTVAHLFKGSRQVLDDFAALQSFIDSRAQYGLMLAEETQLLFGSGLGANLKGLVTLATAYAAPAGITVTAEQHIDRLRLALLQAELAEFPSDGIVINPIDWAGIEMIKDANNNYIIGKPQDGTAARLWNRPVVATQSMTQNDFLVGAFQLGAQIYDRQEAEIVISTENDKDFELNLVSIRAEERLAFAIYRPEAFVTGELTVTP